jgi:hypothetical protein
MSAREIVGDPRELYGIDVSPDLVSAVTDAVLEEIATCVNQHPNGTPPQTDHNAFIQNYTLRSEWGPDRRRSEPSSSTNSTNSINKLVNVWRRVPLRR